MGPSWPLSQLLAARWRGLLASPSPQRAPKTSSPFEGEGKLDPRTFDLPLEWPKSSLLG